MYQTENFMYFKSGIYKRCSVNYKMTDIFVANLSREFLLQHRAYNMKSVVRAERGLESYPMLGQTFILSINGELAKKENRLIWIIQ